MKNITVVLILFLSLSLFSQNNYNYKQIDSLSYNAYLKKDWKTVIKIGKEGLKQDFDYYYLRMRLGIAYYEQEKYRKAAPHFEKALEFNSSDTLATEYLFYSYLFSNQELLARKSMNKLPNTKAKKYLEDFKIVSNIYAFYGTRVYRTKNMESKAQKSYEKEVLADTLLISTSRSYPTNYQNFQIGTDFRILPFWNMELAYQSFNIENKTYILSPNPPNMELGYFEITGNNQIKASQWYIKNTFSISRHFESSLFFDYQDYSSETKYTQPDFIPSNIRLINDTSFNDYQILTGFAINYKQSFFDIDWSTSFLTSPSTPTLQSDLNFNIFPFANNKLSTGIKLTYLGYNDKESSILYSPFVTFKPLKRVNLTLMGSWGDRHNWQSDYGYSLYNGLYIINTIYKAAIDIRVYKGLYLKIHYEYLNRESNIVVTDMITGKEIENKKEIINFGTHSIIGGLIWEF